MQTIIIVLDPTKMENPDHDIRYILPERIEEITKGLVKDNGYDYLPDNSMGIGLIRMMLKRMLKLLLNY